MKKQSWKGILMAGMALVAVPAGMAYTCPVYPRPQLCEMQDETTKIQQVEVLLRGDKSGGMWDDLPADNSAAYALEITPGKLTVYANAEVGVFYAKQTLSQLLEDVPGSRNAHCDPYPDEDIAAVASKGELPCGTLIDWADLPFRGTVEGYYGTPWGVKARINQFDFYGRNKMNTYIYAPKDDPYHHGHGCYQPYPEEKAQEIREMVASARKNHLHFVWAIHPANTVDWNKNGGKDDMDGLCRKLEQMYELGVRDFGVLVDDSSGEIGRPERQVQLCNYILENFIHKHKTDVNQTLIMCPTGYNRSWTNANFLNTLGNGLHKSIPVMWTGDTVVHDITLEGQKWVNEKVQRPTFIWWNWPCTDYKRSRLSMGRTYGLDTDPEMKKQMSGFVANPMEQAEASKLGLFGVANYTWNIEGFRSKKTWRDGIARLYPEVKGEMQVFCKHNAYLLPNYHAYVREESVDIAETAREFVNSLETTHPNYEAVQELKDEYADMQHAAEVLLESPAVADLRAEIRPWLTQFNLLGKAGVSIISALETKTPEVSHKHFFDALDTMTAMKGTERLEWSAGGIKPVADVEVASKELTPALNAAFAYVNRNIYAQVSGIPSALPAFTASAPVSPADARHIADNRTNTFWSTTYRQKEGDWICLDFGVPKDIRTITLLMGGPRPNDYAEEGVFEISNDGNRWNVVSNPVGGPNVVVDLRGMPQRARLLRYRITKPRPNWWSVWSFGINNDVMPFVTTNMEPRPRFSTFLTKEAVGINRVMEVAKLMPDEFIDLEMPKSVRADSLQINVENGDIEKWGKLELTMDFDKKVELPCKAEKNRIFIENLPEGRIKSVRLTNVGENAQEIKLTIFRLALTPGEEDVNPASLLDTDLSTFYNCGRRALDTYLNVPPNSKELVIFGTATCEVEHATLVEQTKHSQIFRLDEGARRIRVKAEQKEGTRVNELIFR